MIEHIADLQSSIAACAACVRPGGLLIVGCPNAEGFLGTEHDNLLNMPPHHVTWWSRGSLQFLAGHLGMVIEEIIEEPLEGQFRRAFMQSFWLNRMLRRGTSGKQFVFAGRGLPGCAACRNCLGPGHGLMGERFRACIKGHTMTAVKPA